MKKIIDFIMGQPIWKVVLGAFLLILMMFQPQTILPILLIGGLVSIWYFIKKKPDVKKRNIALLVAAIASVGTYITGEHSQTALQQVQHQETVVSDSSDDETTTSSEEKEKQEKLDQEKKEHAEKERKQKLEKEKKAEEERKLKEEQERKAKEEREKKKPKLNTLLNKGSRPSNNSKTIKSMKISLLRKLL